jgi:hypothetical protein
VLRLPTRDTNCGVRLIRREALRRLELISQGAFLCAELIARAKSAGMCVREAGVVEYQRPVGRSRFFRLTPLLNLAVELVIYLRRGRARIDPSRP